MQTFPGVQALVRRTHEERVLQVLREQGALSRNQIARAVGLSRTTLPEITGSLLVASGSGQYDDRVDWPTRLDVAFRLVERLSDEYGIHYGALQGAGIGIPGPYSGKPGVRDYPPHRAAADGFHEASVFHSSPLLAGYPEAPAPAGAGSRAAIRPRQTRGVADGRDQ